MRILIVGASGYIGGRLVPLLRSRGDDLVLMSRDARPLAARFPDARVVAADLLDAAILAPALEGIDVAYYLAHSMGAGERGLRRAGSPHGGWARAASRSGSATCSTTSSAPWTIRTWSGSWRSAPRTSSPTAT